MLAPDPEPLPRSGAGVLHTLHCAFKRVSGRKGVAEATCGCIYRQLRCPRPKDIGAIMVSLGFFVMVSTASREPRALEHHD